MTDETRNHPFEDFGTEKVRQGAGLYLLVGVALLVVLMWYLTRPW
jgi:hypothetical protein